ncbi:O-antigen polysaccharide polymerase Wzy family protein [Bacillus toyonensis]|uniref:O-antigen polysaccharide polymerase Wzy family protein n=1 Tax=Bacillus toyonensis TaxID=155322 RepID=UPI002E1FFB79|nr:O-antigen polysaccharide polymerase Wzy family protein [Bacillus toyonensis]
MNILIRYVLLIGALLFFVMGLIFQEPKVLLIATLIIFLHNVVYALEKFYERSIFLCFNLTFFTFLIGRMVVTEIFGYNVNLLGIFGLAFEDESIVNITLICLFLSLFAIFIGYTVIQKADLSFLKKKKELSIGYLYSFRLFSLLFFYFCMIFRLIYVYEMKQTAATEGYYESFMTFTSSLPAILVTIGNMYDVAFFAYLATNPSKRKSFFPVLLYLGEGLFAALAGRRSIFILNLLIVFIYYCLRSVRKTGQQHEQEKKWLGKFEWTLGGIAVPILLAFMTFIGNLRADFSAGGKSKNVGNSILEFFYSQGISANLIGYTKLYENQIPKDKYFTFGPLMEFINNKIIRPLNGLPEYFGQTADRAINGNLFAHTLTYIIMPSAYLLGYGYGSSFVAEMYNDFSFLGVFIGSIIYGIILYLFYYMLQNSNFIVVIFTLMMTRSILFAPRGAALSFIVSSFSMPKVFAVVFIIIGSILLHSIVGKRHVIKQLNGISK